MIMEIAELLHTAETEKGFDDAVVSVLREADKKGWALFAVYDVRERLLAKGFSQERLKIIEICNARHANGMLSKNRLVSLCMPCKINVLEQGGKVIIATMRPSAMVKFFPEISEGDANGVEKELVEMVEGAR